MSNDKNNTQPGIFGHVGFTPVIRSCPDNNNKPVVYIFDIFGILGRLIKDPDGNWEVKKTPRMNNYRGSGPSTDLDELKQDIHNWAFFSWMDGGRIDDPNVITQNANLWDEYFERTSELDD